MLDRWQNKSINKNLNKNSSSVANIIELHLWFIGFYNQSSTATRKTASKPQIYCRLANLLYYTTTLDSTNIKALRFLSNKYENVIKKL